VILPYDDVGSGPVVVLLHAGVADRRMWPAIAGALAEAGYRTVAMDLPGYGDAEPRDRWAPWSDVLETVDELGVGRFAAVGNSFGGAVALRVAVCAPQRVSGLVLASIPPPDLDPSPELAARWAAEEEAMQRGDIDAALAAVLTAWTPADRPDIRALIAPMQRRALELQPAAAALPDAEDPIDADPGAVARLAVPALVCAGALDLPDFRDGARALAAELSDARLVIMPGVGHLAPLEQPAEFTSLVLELLARARF
jgi:pimeloyl-ACP methyl ester carboxylesterase